MSAPSILLILGIVIAGLCGLRLYALLRDGAKRKRREKRRRRNIAHQRAWDWLYPKRRGSKALTYDPLDDRHAKG